MHLPVVFITDLVPGFEPRGSRKVNSAVFDLIYGASRCGLNVMRVIKPHYSVFWRKLDYKNIYFSEFLKEIEVVNVGVFNLPKKGFFPLFHDLKRLENLVFGAALIVSHMPNGGRIAEILSQRTNIPFVHVVHGTDLLDIKCLSRLSDSSVGLLARSHAIGKQLTAKGFEIEGVCFSGVPEHVIKNLEFRPSQKNKKYKVISVCELIELKNIDIVLRALASLSLDVDWEYTVIGDGRDRKRLESLSIDLGVSDRVEFMGHREHDEVLAALQNSTIFVMPSAPESMGLAFLEAMAAGCVVVGAKGWGIDGVVVDGYNGFLTEPRCVDSCAVAIKKALKANVKLKRNSLITIQGFTSEQSHLNYCDSVARILTKIQ
jgi:L-malate glycosyltransferase